MDMELHERFGLGKHIGNYQLIEPSSQLPTWMRLPEENVECEEGVPRTELRGLLSRMVGNPLSRG